MKLGNNRGTGIIEAILILAGFVFLCWFTETNLDTPKNDPQEVVDKK